jgi:hypothetical protein
MIGPHRQPLQSGWLALAAAMFLAILCLGGTALGAAKDEAAAPKGKAVGKSATADSSILRRPAGKKEWQLLGGHGTVQSGDLLVGMPGAVVDSANGAVGLLFQADLDRSSPHPIREAGVIVHANADTDLDMTLDRGRVDLTNLKKKGPAHVHLRVQKAVWDLTLAEPGTKIALELYGRWPAGVSFTKKPGPKDVPTASLIFLVLKGDVTLKHGAIEHTLSAPPGAAMIEWDNFHGQDETPNYLKELPGWAVPDKSARAKLVQAVLEKFRRAIQTKSLAKALDQFVASEDMNERRLALFVMGATDDLLHLADTLRNAKHPDVWDNGVQALRHWIGRAPGQDQILYKAFIEVGKYEPVHAETAVQLLHSFGEDDLAQPETYQTLIDYLEHDKLAIRGLAYWHLIRLVPAGKKLGYNPVDPNEKRDPAVEKWRKLVPKGKVPPRPKAEDEKDNP